MEVPRGGRLVGVVRALGLHPVRPVGGTILNRECKAGEELVLKLKRK